MKEEEPIAPTIAQVKSQWEATTPYYQEIDCTPQTFFYTLMNMLKLGESKNIL
jgi:hypothetical protein